MHAFLMMGQSNMAGRGDCNDVEPIHNTHTYMLRNGCWQPMTEPINCDRAVRYSGKIGWNSGIGPAGSFADAYANYYNTDVGLIPCAEGGSSLEKWQVDGQLFLNAYYQAKLAMNVGTLTGIIWHQGEAESGLEARAVTYYDRFLTIMNTLQERLGVRVPIVVGELGRFFVNHPGKHGYIDVVNAQLHRLAELPNIAIATSEGLTDRGDSLHFDAPSQRIFGRRYFDAYQTLVQPTE